MREIKFRAWDKATRSMIHFDLRDAQNNLFSIREIASRDSWSNPVMQYTGLKDKNGKEIYEGDIVLNHLNGGHYNIKWNYLHVSFALFHGDNMKSEIICDWINDDESTPNQWECKQYEVIGNVHEHPNLLVA